MRCINVALLLLSLSFVASIPIKNENRASAEQELHFSVNKTEEEIVVFPKTDGPIQEIVIIENEPKNTSESFVGPPLNIGRKLLQVKDATHSSARKLLRFRGRISKAIKKVAHNVKKIFHHKGGNGTPSPSPISQQRTVLTKNDVKIGDKITNNELKKSENKMDRWRKSKEGKDAVGYCNSLGLANKKKIFDGCLEDMMVTKDKKIAKESAIAAEEFSSSDKVSSSRRFCTASGDPHFTNYDGAYFHLQEPGVYTLAKTHNYEVQEKMRKNGANRPGVPSCMTGVSVKYKTDMIEADVSNYNFVLINGVRTNLPRDRTLTVGGLKVRFGNQKVEWKGERARSHGLKITSENGFGAMIFGGYCGVVEINAPHSYFGKMKGICGDADGNRNANDFRSPSGSIMNVNYGRRSWEMSGYGGPTAPLSQWQLAWKPTGPDCYFKEGCEKDSPTVAKARADEAARIKAAEDAEIKAEEDAIKAQQEALRLERKRKYEEAKKKREEAQRLEREAKKAALESERRKKDAERKEKLIAERDARKRAEQEELKAIEEFKKGKKSKKGNNSNKADDTMSIVKEFKTKHAISQKKLTMLKKTIIKIINKARTKEVSQLKSVLESKKKSIEEVNEIYKNYKKKVNFVKSLKIKIQDLKEASKKHYEQMQRDTEYLKRLELIKPKFLKTLEKYNSKLSIVRETIKGNIIEGDDKDNMLGLLATADKHTQDSTDKLSKAFLEHYEKYKRLLKTDTSSYEDDVKQLAKETDIYSYEEKETLRLKREYKKAKELLKKIKKSYSLSKGESNDFDNLIKIIKSLLSSPKRIKQFMSKNVRNKCATTLLQSHVANKLI